MSTASHPKCRVPSYKATWEFVWRAVGSETVSPRDIDRAVSRIRQSFLFLCDDCRPRDCYVRGPAYDGAGRDPRPLAEPNAVPGIPNNPSPES